MNPLSDCCLRVRDRLLAAIDFESKLAAKLREHEHALMIGEIDRINALNAELDGFLGSLKRLAAELQDSAIDLADLLNLPARTQLKECFARLPSPAREEMTALRQRLVLARRAAQSASTRNASIARASLDAIHGVRELLGQTPDDGTSRLATVPVGSGGRLDAEA